MAEALKGPYREEWVEAIKREVQGLHANGTWEYVSRDEVPAGKTILPLKFVLKTKWLANGDFEKFKARLVARGFKQRPGQDYVETFAPASHAECIRVLLAIAAYYRLDVESTDVTQAFTQASLRPEEEVYTELPDSLQRMDAKGRPMVGRLRKGLYGLHQASRCFHYDCAGVLQRHGLQPLKSEPCIWAPTKKDAKTPRQPIVASHVDDHLHMGEPTDILRTKTMIADHYDINDKGELTEFVGFNVNVNQEEGTITLDQAGYAASLLDDTGMSDCNPVGAPMDKNQKWSREPDSAAGERYLTDQERKHFRSTTQRLAWLRNLTRPDLENVTNILQSVSAKPTTAHLAMLKRTLRYLKGEPDRPIIYHKRRVDEPEIIQLYGFADASFNTEPKGRSRTGTVIMLAGGAVSWSSRVQRVPALSTAEAETLSMCSLARDVIFFRGLLDELGMPQPTTILFEDNQPCIDILRQDQISRRTRHIALKYWFIRDLVERQQVEIRHLPTRLMLADAFTKQLSNKEFHRHLDVVMGKTRPYEEIITHLRKTRGNK